jgi:integrase
MKSLTRSQLDSLLTVARSHSEMDYVALLVGFNHGLRVSEILALTKDNIVDGHLVVQRLKGSNKTIQALLPNEQPLLEQLVKSSEGRFFKTTRKTMWVHVKQYAAEAGVPSFLATPHKVCKHSCAMAGLRGGMSIPELQTYLGHVSGSNTLRYLQVDEDVASSAFAKAVGA